MADINQIKEYHKMAEVRQKQGVQEDEQFLLEDDIYLLPQELKERNL